MKQSYKKYCLTKDEGCGMRSGQKTDVGGPIQQVINALRMYQVVNAQLIPDKNNQNKGVLKLEFEDIDAAKKMSRWLKERNIPVLYIFFETAPFFHNEDS